MKSQDPGPVSAIAVAPSPLPGTGRVATGDRGLGTQDSRPEGRL
jgi:hypothetical protein